MGAYHVSDYTKASDELIEELLDDRGKDGLRDLTTAQLDEAIADVHRYIDSEAILDADAEHPAMLIAYLHRLKKIRSERK